MPHGKKNPDTKRHAHSPRIFLVCTLCIKDQGRGGEGGGQISGATPIQGATFAVSSRFDTQHRSCRSFGPACHCPTRHPGSRIQQSMTGVCVFQQGVQRTFEGGEWLLVAALWGEKKEGKRGNQGGWTHVYANRGCGIHTRHATDLCMFMYVQYPNTARHLEIP